MGLIVVCPNSCDDFTNEDRKSTLLRRGQSESTSQLNKEKNEFDTINIEKSDFEQNIPMREQNEKLTNVLNDILQNINQQNELKQTSISSLHLQTSTVNYDEKVTENAEQIQPQNEEVLDVQHRNTQKINKQTQIETSSQISVDTVLNLNDDETVKVHINNDEDVQSHCQTKHLRFYTETNDNDFKKEDENDELCTLRQLVWCLTDEWSTTDGQISVDVLLLCHAVFAKSSDLLACLVERFNSADMDGNERWNIQIKVGAILSSWMKTLWEDFEANPDLMEDLQAFFASIETKFSGDKRVQVLLKKMKQIYLTSYHRVDTNERQTKIQHKDIGKLIGKPAHFNIVDQDAKTLAEQFTLMHFKAFKAITKRECLGQSWKKKDGSAQNILNMIKLFNSTVKWVQILILTQQTPTQRAQVMKLCIKIATFMKEFRNFSGACAFHSALTSTPIHRLKIAWNKLSTDKMQKYKELQKIFGFGNKNWKLLRKLHREAHAPAILHTGLFLSDLVGIDEGNINKLKDGQVNFKKLLKLHQTIGTISMYQQEEYQFKENLLIQSVIEQDFKGQEEVDDDLMFKMSSSVKASAQASVQKRKQGLFEGL